MPLVEIDPLEGRPEVELDAISDAPATSSFRATPGDEMGTAVPAFSESGGTCLVRRIGSASTRRPVNLRVRSKRAAVPFPRVIQLFGALRLALGPTVDDRH